MNCVLNIYTCRVNDAGQPDDGLTPKERYADIAVDNLITLGQARVRDELRKMLQAWERA